VGWQGYCLCLLAFTTGVAHAGSTSPQVQRSGRSVNVNFNVEAAAPPETCYSVIADFTHLAGFVPSLDSSEVVSRDDEPLRIRQIGHARAGFRRYKLDVTLDIQLDPPRRISFNRVAGNVRRMHGSWSISGSGENSCRIGYVAQIEPDFWIPPLIGPIMIRSTVQDQITALLQEIARRASPVDASPPRT
jgi:ribosome-associated toxin RatA of RatAB toxin-antitoxin module